MHFDDFDGGFGESDWGWNDEPSRAEPLPQIRSGVFTTDAQGRLTYYNEAAADLWGYRPELGKARWCGSWRLYQSDGSPLSHDRCPMAAALQGGRTVQGTQAVLERPDGTRVAIVSYPTLLRDTAGALLAGCNVLLETQQQASQDGRRRFRTPG